MLRPLSSGRPTLKYSPTLFVPKREERLVKRIGERAGFPFKVHVHMLRHACGYALANAGHDTRAIPDWLGHPAHRPLHGIEPTAIQRFLACLMGLRAGSRFAARFL
jgi:hypothetical protein